MSSNNLNLTIKYELKEKKKWIWTKWRGIRCATNYYNSDEKDFDYEYEARELERNLKLSMKN